MIYGIGVDLCEIDRMEKLLTHSSFIKRVLTVEEIKLLKKYTSKKRQAEFLAGRFACKEAYSKAYGTGIGEISFQDMEILAKDSGAPYFNLHPLKNKKVHVSITHSKNEAAAFVVIEE